MPDPLPLSSAALPLLEIVRKLDAIQALPLGQGYPGAEIQALKREAAELLERIDAAPVDLSGGDPAYELITSGGPVTLTLQAADDVIELKASFSTIADAVSYLNTSKTIDPVDLEEGRYGIDAPHGVASDDEAVTLARDLGFEVFWSMGAACWAPKGVSISGNISGRGWKTGFQNLEAAALAALASTPPV